MPTARRTTRRLPRPPLTSGAVTLIGLYVVVQTWPVQTAVIATLLALAGAAAAVLLGRLDPRARRQLLVTLPRPRRAPARSLAAYPAMSPDDFEDAIADLARRDPGVRSATAQGGADDRGLDVLVRLHDGRRILIQCKRYGPRNRVTSEDVQKTNGTYRDIHHCQLGVIVTTSGYTRSAIQTNTMLRQPLLLVDGPGLADWTRGGPPPWA